MLLEFLKFSNNARVNVFPWLHKTEEWDKRNLGNASCEFIWLHIFVSLHVVKQTLLISLFIFWATIWHNNNLPDYPMLSNGV